MWTTCVNCSKNVSKWVPKRGKMEAWGLPGTSFGGSGGHVGAQGSPIRKNNKKRNSIQVFLGSLFATFLLTFPIFVLFGTCFLRVFVFTPFGHSIYTVLGTILRGFLCLISKAFQVKHGNEKCSLDSLFTIYEAHCLSVQKAKKGRKNIKKWRYLVERLKTHFLTPF